MTDILLARPYVFTDQESTEPGQPLAPDSALELVGGNPSPAQLHGISTSEEVIHDARGIGIGPSFHGEPIPSNSSGTAARKPVRCSSPTGSSGRYWVRGAGQHRRTRADQDCTRVTWLEPPARSPWPSGSVQRF